MLQCRIQEATAKNLTVASNRGQKTGLFGRICVILRMRNARRVQLPRNYSITVIARRISAYLQLEIRHAHTKYTTHRALVEYFIAA